VPIAKLWSTSILGYRLIRSGVNAIGRRDRKACPGGGDPGREKTTNKIETALEEKPWLWTISIVVIF
jgi:hypothetical protein